MHHRVSRTGHRHHPGDPAGPVGHRFRHLRAGAQPGPGGHRVAGQDVVEVVPAAGEAEVRVATQRGPVDLHLPPAGHPAHPARPRPAGGLDVDAHPDQLVHRTRGETVTADLLPGERGLLQQQHIDARSGQVEGGGRAGRPRAHHDHLGLLGQSGGGAFVRGGPVCVRFPHGNPFLGWPATARGR